MEVVKIFGLRSGSNNAGDRIPLFAMSVAAGTPVPAESDIESSIDLNEFLIEHPASTFFAHVAGDNLTDEGIEDGDILIVDTHGSDFDTVLAAYTGLDVSNLTQIAANDDAGAGIQTSEVDFQFNPGITYRIVVDGKTDSDTGNITLNYALIPEPCYLLFVIYWKKINFLNYQNKRRNYEKLNPKNKQYFNCYSFNYSKL